MLHCDSCGAQGKVIHTVVDGHKKQLCPSCYKYYVVDGEHDYDIPDKGVIACTPEGKVICHICGKAYKKLGNHIYQIHHITTKEYRKQFELKKKPLTELGYHLHMREIIDPKSVQNLEAGKDNRFGASNANRQCLALQMYRNRCGSCVYRGDNYQCLWYNKECKEVFKCERSPKNG